MEGTTPRKRHSPGSLHTLARQRRRERERDAFALAPVLRALERRRARANGDVAMVLNRRGVPSESGRPWSYQAVASVRHRLAVLEALPCRFRVPRARRGASRQSGVTKAQKLGFSMV